MPSRPICVLESCSSPVQSRLPLQRRFQSTGAVLKGDLLGPVRQDAHQSFRDRKHGKPLPLPPLLDEVVLAERSRWEQPKAKPDVNKFTPFQKKLWENPYAHALASPIRQCRVTALRLPDAFLTSLHIRLHPETKEPWLLPVNLTTSNKRLGHPARILGHKFVLEFQNQNKTPENCINRRMGTMLAAAKLKRPVWREDMPELILSLMRKKTANKLAWYFKRSGRLVPCASVLAKDIDDNENVSCVLHVGSLKTVADDIQAKTHEIVKSCEKSAIIYFSAMKDYLDPHKSKSVTHNPPYWWSSPLVPRLQPRLRYPPLEFKTTEWRGSRVAVYSLTDLLGEEQTKKLVKDSKYSGGECWVLRRGRHNVPVELLLMQLQSYLAVPGP